MTFIISFFVFLFGLIIGSFLNCLIWRVYKGEGMWNRSYCPKCKKQIAWYDNIPVLSFLALGGRCRHCKKKISWQYPIVEFLTGILFVISWNLESGIWNLDYGVYQNLIPNSQFLISIFRDWFIIAVMIVIFVIDLRWYLILDVVTLPAMAIIFVLNLTLNLFPESQIPLTPFIKGGILSWQNMLISGIIGGSFFLIQFLISRGKWIGGGDIRLGVLIGLIFGWPNVLTAIFLAYFIGSFVGIGLILGGKKKWSSKVPLGTFLAVSSIITLLWGDKIVSWYFNQLSIFN